MIGNMDLNVPFTVKDHLTLDALVSLLLNSGKKETLNKNEQCWTI